MYQSKNFNMSISHDKCSFGMFVFLLDCTFSSSFTATSPFRKARNLVKYGFIYVIATCKRRLWRRTCRRLRRGCPCKCPANRWPSARRRGCFGNYWPPPAGALRGWSCDLAARIGGKNKVSLCRLLVFSTCFELWLKGFLRASRLFITALKSASSKSSEASASSCEIEF